LASNGNYQFILTLHGRGVAATGKPFAVSVAGTSTVSARFDASVYESSYYDRAAMTTSHEYTFRVFGTATGGTSGGALYVSVTDGTGLTGTTPLTLTGLCTLQAVETIL